MRIYGEYPLMREEAAEVYIFILQTKSFSEIAKNQGWGGIEFTPVIFDPAKQIPAAE